MNLELKKLIKLKIWFRIIIESHGLGENTQAKNYREEKSENRSLGNSQIKNYEDGGKASKKSEKEDQ